MKGACREGLVGRGIGERLCRVKRGEEVEGIERERERER